MADGEPNHINPRRPDQPMTHTYTTVATRTAAEAAIYDGICQRISREFSYLFASHKICFQGDAADGSAYGETLDGARSVMVHTAVEMFSSARFWRVRVHVCFYSGDQREEHSYTVSPDAYGPCSDGTFVPLFVGLTPFSDAAAAFLAAKFPATTTETTVTTTTETAMTTETETTETPARATAEQVQAMYARLEAAVAGIRLPREMEWVVRAIPGEISIRVEATGRRYRDYDYGFVISAHRVWTLGRLEQAAFDDLVDEARSWNFDAEFDLDLDRA